MRGECWSTTWPPFQERYRAAHGRFAPDYSALFDPGAPRLTSRALSAVRPGFDLRVAGADAAG